MTNFTLFYIATPFMVLTCLISFYSITKHLKNYRRPDLQRLIVRILLMPFIYGFTSWMSLRFSSAADYLDPLRDCYEAFVLYMFFSLLVHLLDGEAALLRLLDDGRPPTTHFFPFNLCLAPIDFASGRNFWKLKIGILQFLVVKPLHSLLIIVLKAANLYKEGSISADSGYIYVSLLYNISVCICMYCLVLFYYTTHNDLARHKPLVRFMMPLTCSLNFFVLRLSSSFRFGSHC
jgi:hypothetical protein